MIGQRTFGRRGGAQTSRRDRPGCVKVTLRHLGWAERQAPAQHGGGRPTETGGVAPTPGQRVPVTADMRSSWVVGRPPGTCAGRQRESWRSTDTAKDPFRGRGPGDLRKRLGREKYY